MKVIGHIVCILSIASANSTILRPAYIIQYSLGEMCLNYMHYNQIRCKHEASTQHSIFMSAEMKVLVHQTSSNHLLKHLPCALKHSCLINPTRLAREIVAIPTNFIVLYNEVMPMNNILETYLSDDQGTEEW